MKIISSHRDGMLTETSIECVDPEELTHLKRAASSRISRTPYVAGLVARYNLSRRDTATLMDIVEGYNARNRIECAPDARHESVTADNRKIRILVPASAHQQDAPANIVRRGVVRKFHGYGKMFRINEDDAAANGFGPWVDFVRYAYYV